MMVLRWLYFGIGTCGWVLIVFHIWRAMGWFFGAFAMVIGLLMVLQWLEETVLKQWKMKKIVTYKEEV